MNPRLKCWGYREHLSAMVWSSFSLVGPLISMAMSSMIMSGRDAPFWSSICVEG